MQCQAWQRCVCCLIPGPVGVNRSRGHLRGHRHHAATLTEVLAVQKWWLSTNAILGYSSRCFFCCVCTMDVYNYRRVTCTNWGWVWVYLTLIGFKICQTNCCAMRQCRGFQMENFGLFLVNLSSCPKKNVIFEVGHSKNKKNTSGKVFGVSQDSTGAVKEII